jgi:hypothetical protein
MKKLKQLQTRIVLGAGSLLLTAGDALAKVESSGNVIDQAVNGMDPAIQPYARLVADNIVFLFVFLGGASLLYYGALSAAEKKKGHSQQAADYKKNTIEAFKQLGIALVLFGIFSAVVKSNSFGLL